jgi:hypothetical protein
VVRAWRVVAAFGVWSVFVWSTRLVNIWRDYLLTTDEKVAASVIALVFVVLGLTVIVIAVGFRRWPATRGDVIAIGALAGWTGGVWFLRTIDIVGGDHSAAFVAVHVALAVISVALAGFAWRAVATVPVAAGTDDATGAVDGGADAPADVTADATADATVDATVHGEAGAAEGEPASILPGSSD